MDSGVCVHRHGQITDMFLIEQCHCVTSIIAMFTYGNVSLSASVIIGFCHRTITVVL